jgi:iron complex outermembrane recepter protein
MLILTRQLPVSQRANHRIATRCHRLRRWLGRLIASSWVLASFPVGAYASTSLENEAVFDLDAFIVAESAQAQVDSIQPSVLRSNWLGDTLPLTAIPRAITVITPELRALFNIHDLEGLSRYAAGAERFNYFGLAGSPVLRGARAGTYFNGMLRAYQRNEMPLSFGSTDSLQLVRGPTPAHMAPTLVGGYLNLEPKSPFYDKARTVLEAGVGAFNSYTWQLDNGAPLMLGKTPAAYRVSLSGQRADRFWDNVGNDFDSVYVALKLRPSRRSQLFVGGEYFDYRSSEAPGANRPTPQLIDSRRYVIGEPPLATTDDWRGGVARTLTEYPFTLVVQPALHALAVPGPLARSQIAPALLQTMINLNDAAQRQQVYALRPNGAVPSFVYGGNPAVLAGLQAVASAELAAIGAPAQDAYVYTPAYFAAGGKALTANLDRQRILADPQDYADAQNAIAFADFELFPDADSRLRLRLFAESLDSDKYSSYGFAMRTRQAITHLRAEWQQTVPRWRTSLQLGLDLRATYARMLQDFDAEPFSRRDLAATGISPNSVVAAGPQTGPDGLNLWSSFGGASQLSHLWQTGLYLGSHTAIAQWWDVYLGLRLENARFSSRLPHAVDRASTADRTARFTAGNEPLNQASIHSSFHLGPAVHPYFALQLGRALAPADGGTVAGRSSFTDTELYEVGLKLGQPNGNLYATVAGWYWDQATWSTRDAAANPLRASGLEVEATWQAASWLTIMGSLTAQRLHLRTATLGFGALPLDEQGWALNGGILNAAGGRSVLATNPDMVLAGIAELAANLHAVVDLPYGLRLATGPQWRDGHWADMGRSLRIPSHVLWQAQLVWQRDAWSVRANVDNLFDTGYWTALDPVFAANTLVLPGAGRSWQIKVRREW